MKKQVVALTTAIAVMALGAPAFAATTATPGASIAAEHPLMKHMPRQTSTSISPFALTGYGWSSTNWSGYAITGSYSSITGTWKVPSVSATSGNSYSSSWIGIDGFNNSNLIQTGTESDYTNGAAYYAAWWEILPASETRISMTVHPGDTMYADIHKVSGSTWSITIKDQTTGASFSTNQTYSGAGTSAEWIQEAPTVGGKVATLSHYSTTLFDPGTANGVSPNLALSNGGYMTTSSGTVISVPSAPDADKDGFNVAYGSTAPSAPAS